MKNPVTKLVKKLFGKKSKKGQKVPPIYEEVKNSCHVNYAFSEKKKFFSPKKTIENEYGEYKGTPKPIKYRQLDGFDDITWLTKSRRQSMAPEALVQETEDYVVEEPQVNQKDDEVIFREKRPPIYKSISMASMKPLSMDLYKLTPEPERIYYTPESEGNSRLRPVITRKPTPYGTPESPYAAVKKRQEKQHSPPRYSAIRRARAEGEPMRHRQSMPLTYPDTPVCRCRKSAKGHVKLERKDSLAEIDLEMLLDDAYLRMTTAKKLWRIKSRQMESAVMESRKAGRRYEAMRTDFRVMRDRRASMPSNVFETYERSDRSSSRKPEGKPRHPRVSAIRQYDLGIY